MKTRSVVMSMALMLIFAGSAFSQSVDIFGGYSYQRTASQGLNGFNAAVTNNFSRMLGLTGEVSRHSWGMTFVDPNDPSMNMDVNANILAFRFGPKFTGHLSDSASFFVQPVAGFYRMSAGGTVSGMSGSASGTGFTTAAGAGFDINVHPRVSVRPAQLDWIYLRSASIAGVVATGSSNGFRYSGGVVVKF